MQLKVELQNVSGVANSCLVLRKSSLLLEENNSKWWHSCWL